MTIANIGAFLDRDGVINEEIDLLYRVDQLSLINGAPEAIRELNQAGIKVVVVTNQPVVARGLCTESEIDRIHEVLESMLAKHGARLDAIYYCPHHENADLESYRTICQCRKPDIGMLTKAAQRFELDLASSYMVGDRTADIYAGLKAGCKTILLKTGWGGTDKKFDVNPDYICDDLCEAVKIILTDVSRRQNGETLQS